MEWKKIYKHPSDMGVYSIKYFCDRFFYSQIFDDLTMYMHIRDKTNLIPKSICLS